MNKEEMMLQILNKYHSFLNDQLPLQNVLHSELVKETMYRQVILKSMTEYAAHQSVEFAKWCDKDGWELDYREQHTHTYQEKYQYWITNIYLKEQGV